MTNIIKHLYEQVAAFVRRTYTRLLLSVSEDVLDQKLSQTLYRTSWVYVGPHRIQVMYSVRPDDLINRIASLSIYHQNVPQVVSRAYGSTMHDATLVFGANQDTRTQWTQEELNAMVMREVGHLVNGGYEHHTWFYGQQKLQEDLDADQFAVEQGYGKELVSALIKQLHATLHNQHISQKTRKQLVIRIKTARELVFDRMRSTIHPKAYGI